MRPITQILTDYNGGKFADELTEAMHNLVGDCTATGKKGELVISISLKPAKGTTPALHLMMDFKDKSPEFEPPSEYMFVGKDNDLLRDNPQQRRLELREVSRDPLPLHDPATGEVLSESPQHPPQQQQRAS